MDIREAIRQFEEAELVVLPLPSLRLARSCEVIDDDPLRHRYEDLSGIWYEENTWVFHRWHSVPGPSYDDIHFESDNLDRIVEGALNYYFGESTIIDQWIIPLHRHPEWDAARLPSVIDSARRVSPTDWKAIHKNYTDRRWQLHPHGTLSEIFACLFNPIDHMQNSNLTLYLRRDLAEAFIIEQPV